MIEQLSELELLAAEYALGVLSGAERRRAEALAAQDNSFAREIEDWTQRLAPLVEAVPPERVPMEVWELIDAALHARASERRIASFPGTVWSESLAFWRWMTVGAAASATAAAAALALSVWLPTAPFSPNQADRYVAVLNRDAGAPSWLVTADVAERRLTVRPVAKVAAGGRAMELWLLAGTVSPPRSLGLLDPEKAFSLSLSAAWTEAEEPPRALAISLEPPGGSPTGLPTGPVVFQGSLLPLD